MVVYLKHVIIGDMMKKYKIDKQSFLGGFCMGMSTAALLWGIIINL